MLDATRNSLDRRWDTAASVPTSYTYRLVKMPLQADVFSVIYDILSTIVDPQVYNPVDGHLSQIEMSALMSDIWESFIMTNPFIGAVLPIATSAIPPNMLLCNGAIYNKADYPELYEVLASGLKLANGTQFRVPDLVNRYPRGTGAFGTVGNQAGSNTVTLTVNNIPKHTHTVPEHGHTTQPHYHLFDPAVVGDLDVEGVGVPQPTAAQIVPLIQDSTVEATVIVNNAPAVESGNGTGFPASATPFTREPASTTLAYGIVAR